MKHFTITEPVILMLGSDGIWDQMTTTKVQQIITETNPTKKWEELEKKEITTLLKELNHQIPSSNHQFYFANLFFIFKKKKQVCFHKWGGEKAARDDISLIITFLK